MSGGTEVPPFQNKYLSGFEDVLIFGAGLGAFAGSLAGLADALVGDLHGVRHLFGGGSREGTIETCDIDPAVAHLGVYGGVHRGEELVAKLVEDAVDVEIWHTLTIPELCHDGPAESRIAFVASE